MSAFSLAPSNVRAIVILIVLGLHSMSAYLVWAPIAAATDFVSPPYAWRSFPIIDDHRFFGFDLFCAWQDVYLMAVVRLLPSRSPPISVSYWHARPDAFF